MSLEPNKYGSMSVGCCRGSNHSSFAKGGLVNQTCSPLMIKMAGTNVFDVVNIGQSRFLEQKSTVKRRLELVWNRIEFTKHGYPAAVSVHVYR